MTSGTERSELMCSTCGRETPQDALYAGRLLTHITCTVCGTVVHFEGADLKEEYLADLRHRLQSKPRRLWHRATKHPVRFVATLPGAIVRQPGKLLRELRSVQTEEDK